MTGYFITATGTDAGKTLITAGLAWQAAQAGKAVHAVKPVASGFDESQWEASDAAKLIKATGAQLTHEALDASCPWRFFPPVSPHAVQENKLTLEEITDFCRQQLAKPGVTLIEGAGGIMTPLAQGVTQLDLLAGLRIPTVLVARNYLGAISHTLTALEAAQARDVHIGHIILNASEGDNAEALQQTAQAIRSHSRQPVRLSVLPWIATEENPWQYLPSLWDEIEHDR